MDPAGYFSPQPQGYGYEPWEDFSAATPPAPPPGYSAAPTGGYSWMAPDPFAPETFGYAGCIDPTAPPVLAWGDTVGQQAGRQLGELLGELGGGTVTTLGRQLVADPYVQQQLTQLRSDCQTKAKAGVSEWMRENWWVLIGAGALLIFGNAAMLALAVAPTLRRMARR